MRLPRRVVRQLTRGVVRPLLSPRFPLVLRRPLLDVTGRVVPLPRGTRRSRGTLGGVPTERVATREAAGPHQVLYVHGGGYQTGSPASHRALAAHLSRAAGAPVHLPVYRLAPEHPYPAAVDDVVSAYLALRDAGHPPQRIAVAGDSAGGGLVMALVLRLRAAGEELPGSIGLISPWLDLDLTSPLLAVNAGTDAMLDPNWLPDAVDRYLGVAGPRAAGAEQGQIDKRQIDTVLRPLDADLAGLPPVHVIAGGDEVLLGDSDTLVARIRAAGSRVDYLRAEGLWHAFPVFAGMLREADEAVAALGAAMRSDCAGGPASGPSGTTTSTSPAGGSP
ncbi:acetyl esterase/lipase [Pseudonocardia hierapolitana]|uniref:Acetyl esterase/lipase n=1 Tax=Pseudonocardia hierapolitana TaxID=1128676 RepID=A0A561STX2_9PSEU|nr:acetyl esterase/lipase [Pseudonocardia hierapolitana]